MPGPPGGWNTVIVPGEGRNVVGCLGIDAALDRVAANVYVALRERQVLARRDTKLGLDDVDAGHELRHRMLDLQPRIHLDEVEPAVFVQELEGSRPAVADLAACRDASRAHRLAHFRVDPGSRSLFEHFLVPALHRAVALAEMHDVAVGIGKDLELDVPRVLEILLEVDGVVAERRAGPRCG